MQPVNTRRGDKKPHSEKRTSARNNFRLARHSTRIRGERGGSDFRAKQFYAIRGLANGPTWLPGIAQGPAVCCHRQPDLQKICPPGHRMRRALRGGSGKESRRRRTVVYSAQSCEIRLTASRSLRSYPRVRRPENGSSAPAQERSDRLLPKYRSLGTTLHIAGPASGAAP